MEAIHGGDNIQQIYRLFDENHEEPAEKRAHYEARLHDPSNKEMVEREAQEATAVAPKSCMTTILQSRLAAISNNSAR